MIEVKGNGNIVSREIKVSSFIRLHLSAKGLIELHQSDEEKVVVETDSNLQEYFEIINSGRTLYVTTESKFRSPGFTSCKIKIFFRQLHVLNIRSENGDFVCPEKISLTNPIEIKIQSIGNTTLEIDAPAIKLINQCQGNVLVKGKCNSIEIKNQSEGDLITKDLIAEMLTIKNRSEGNVEVFARKEITISHFGEGHIYYTGDAILKDVKHFGDGEIRHINIMSNTNS